MNQTITGRFKSSFIVGILLIPVFLMAEDLVKKEYKYEVSTKELLQIRFEIDAGRIQIESGSSSNEVSMIFKFDDKRHNISVDFDERSNFLRIHFDVNDWFEEHDDKDGYTPGMTMKLPTDARIELDGKIKAGECDIELGGLYIRNLNLRVLAGQTTVSFAKPNKERLNELEIDSKFGELILRQLGNANFEFASINGVIGSMTVDLTSDRPLNLSCEVDISMNIGETRVYLPENDSVRFSVSKFLFFSSVDIPSRFYKRGNYFYSDDYARSDIKMDISISPGLGTLDIGSR